MTGLTKNIRTHKVIFKDGRKEISITQEQYAMLRLAKEDEKMTKIVTIQDPDTGKILYDGEIGKILEFEAREINKGQIKGICQYGKIHNFIGAKIQCDCLQNYGYYRFELLSWASKKFNLKGSHQITSEMRKEFWQIKNAKKENI